MTQLHELGLAQLRALLDAGTVSPRELTQALLDRIERYNPQLHAVLEINPEVLTEPEIATTGPLAGIPVLVKDNIDTAAPLHTTAGSLALARGYASGEAAIVRALRQAGALIIGKANLSEWSNYRSPHSTSGWSAVGGLAANPHDLTRSAGGSSSGSGVAVAAGFVPLAIGTETDGSISCPASLNGVVGIKPTVGLVPRTGIVPISFTQDTAGPMARSVADAATLLTVMAGTHAGDAMTSRAGRPAPIDYAVAARPGRLSGLRIGVPRTTSLFGYHTQTDELVLRAIDVLADLGAEIVDDVLIPGIEAMETAEATVLDHELKDGLARYLATRRQGPQNLAEVIAFNREHEDDELRWFGQELFERAEATQGLSAEVYRQAQEVCLRASTVDGIDGALRRHRLDLLAMPCYPPAWVSDVVMGDQVLGSCSTLPAVVGYPLLSVPCGTVAGPSGPLPVGLALTAGAWSEAVLIRVAAAYEAAAGEVVPAPALGGI